MKCPDDYSVILVRLPGDVLSVLRVDASGYPTVYINEALSTPAKRRALQHELWHYHNGDFDSHATIYDAEARACAAAKIEIFPRSFARLTHQQEADIYTNGLALLLHTSPPPAYDLLLDMPAPMYDSEPPAALHDKGDQPCRA